MRGVSNPFLALPTNRAAKPGVHQSGNGPAEIRARITLDGRAPEDVPQVADWRATYRAFDAKPRTRPSVDALRGSGTKSAMSIVSAGAGLDGAGLGLAAGAGAWRVAVEGEHPGGLVAFPAPRGTRGPPTGGRGQLGGGQPRREHRVRAAHPGDVRPGEGRKRRGGAGPGGRPSAATRDPEP